MITMNLANEQEMEQVNHWRRKREEKLARRQEVLRTSLTVPEIRENVRKAIRGHEARYNTEGQLAGFAGAPNRNFHPDLPTDAHDFWMVLVLLFGEEEILNRVEAFFAEREADRLSLPERKDLLAKLDQQIRVLEVNEEKEILRLEDQRLTVLRRKDADPQVLLEVWATYRPEAARKTPAKPLGLGKPKHINDGANSVHAPISKE